MKKFDRNTRLLLSCAILTVLAVFSAVFIEPEAAGVFKTAGGGERKLPIYSVDTKEKKAALTFDAAWGAVI